MIIGLLGDVHGNDLALEVVLRSAKLASVEKLLITGDLVGYYFAPHRVLELLKPWDVCIVRGNHEDMLKAVLDDRSLMPAIEHRYGSGLRVALETLSESQVDFLCSLPRIRELTLGSRRIFLCHGTPWDTDQYVYPDAQAELLSRCALPEFDFVVMGHTHYPMTRIVGKTTLVNPGSVGQPRHRHPGACWAMLDTETGDVEMRSENYDIQRVISEAQARHPGMPYLAEILCRT